MSADELEDLMSQLNTNSQNIFHTNALGLKNDPLGWSYTQEQDYTRNGRKRGFYRGKEFHARPLPDLDKIDMRRFKPPVQYIPSFGEFVVDDQGRQLEIPNLAPNTPLDYQTFTLAELWALFWNEHWEKQAIKKRLYNLINSMRNGSTNFGGQVHIADTQDRIHFPAPPTSAPGHVVAPAHTSSGGTHTHAVAKAPSYAEVAHAGSFRPNPPKSKQPPKPPAVAKPKSVGTANGSPAAASNSTQKPAGRGIRKQKGKDAKPKKEGGN